jgi:small multidrug resistance pump
MTTTPLTFLTLGIAIVLEVIGTTLLQRSEQFTKFWPTLGVGVFYIGAFYFLSLTLRTMPVGIAYALWSGIGIILISAIGVVVFKQTLDGAAMIGLGFIIVGVVIVNVFSKSAAH